MAPFAPWLLAPDDVPTTPDLDAFDFEVSVGVGLVTDFEVFVTAAPRLGSTSLDDFVVSVRGVGPGPLDDFVVSVSSRATLPDFDVLVRGLPPIQALFAQDIQRPVGRVVEE